MGVKLRFMGVKLRLSQGLWALSLGYEHSVKVKLRSMGVKLRSWALSYG